MRVTLIIAAGALVGCTAPDVRRDLGNVVLSGESPPPPAAPLDVTIALTTGTPEAMMRAAVETCLVEFEDLHEAVAIFRSAEWQVMAGAGLGGYELGRDQVIGSLDASDGTSKGCRFESSGVSLEQARGIAQGLVDEYFEAAYRAGSPDGATGACDGFTISPGGGQIVISYDGVGRNPICPDPKGSAIVVSTSSG